MKKGLKVILILIVAGVYGANLSAQTAGNASDIAAQAAVVAAGNDAGSAAGGAFGPPDDEVEDQGDAAAFEVPEEGVGSAAVGAGQPKALGDKADGGSDAVLASPEGEAGSEPGTAPESPSDDKSRRSGMVPRG